MSRNSQVKQRTPMTDAEFQRALYRMAANQPPIGKDYLGYFMRTCARSRQLICRDRECVAQRCCKSFPQEIAELAN